MSGSINSGGDSLQLFPTESLPDPLTVSIPPFNLLVPPQTPRASELGLPAPPLSIFGTNTQPASPAAPITPTLPPDTESSEYARFIGGREGTGRNRMGSSAYGYGQFMPDTYLAFAKANPSLFEGMNEQQILDTRSIPSYGIRAINWYARDNADYFRKNGIDPTPQNLGLAHYFGPAGAAPIINAPDNDLVSKYVSSKVMKFNPNLVNLTVGQLKAQYAKTPTPPGLDGADSGVAPAPGTPPPPGRSVQDVLAAVGPGGQQPDIKALTTLSLLKSLLPTGMGFHPIDYDPIIKGVLRQGHQEVSPALHGLPSMFPDARQQISHGGEPATSPAKIIQDQLAAHLRRTR